MLELHFNNIFTTLPADFYTKMLAEKVSKKPFLIAFNKKGADLIDLDCESINNDDFALYFSGNKLINGSEPLAQVYSGHQFGMWAGQLGDGRALLLGQVLNQKGKLWDVQLKGSGLTPYSRMGDGRAIMGSSIREYLISENIYALNIDTTRSLCVIGTGEPVFRETVHQGAIFTRLARSHIRFGHFEHFASKGDAVNIIKLADHVIENYCPYLNSYSDKYVKWFEDITEKTATMIAGWQSVGFCHGVLNTDNMSILGLTIDYGPFGFIEKYNPNHICNSSDHEGRYAFNQQPAIGLWNLYALAQSLNSLIPFKKLEPILKSYDEILTNSYKSLMREKIGIDKNIDDHDGLWISLLGVMQKQSADYTLTFRYLSDSFINTDKWLGLFYDKKIASAWLTKYHDYIINSNKDISRLKDNLNSINPKYVLRNWVAQTAIKKIEEQKDYEFLNEILCVLQQPCKEHMKFDKFAMQASKEFSDLSVSCSS